MIASSLSETALEYKVWQGLRRVVTLEGRVDSAYKHNKSLR